MPTVFESCRFCLSKSETKRNQSHFCMFVQYVCISCFAYAKARSHRSQSHRIVSHGIVWILLAWLNLELTGTLNHSKIKITCVSNAFCARFIQCIGVNLKCISVCWDCCVRLIITITRNNT